MDRPLFNKSTDELEQLFRECANHPDQLIIIAAELIHRKRPKAIALRKKIEDALAKRDRAETCEATTPETEIVAETSSQIVVGNEIKSPLDVEVPEKPNSHVLQDYNIAETFPLSMPSCPESTPLKPRQEARSIPLRPPPRSTFKDGFLTWISWTIPLLLACITLGFLSPGKPHYGALYEPPQPVEVSSYTRSDGTQVAGYNRALPGDRASAEAMNEPIRSRNRQEKKRVEQGASIALFVTIVVFWISRTYIKIYLDETAAKRT